MERKKVFVIMPFDDQFREVYETLKMQFADSFDFSNADEEGNQQNILKDIIQPIYEADIIIADLTNLNPNVMYELGLAHSFNKKTIMITQDELSSLPFDLKLYRTKNYNIRFKSFFELLEYLRINMNGAVDNSVIFGNPVKDFLNSEGLEHISWNSKDEAVELDDDSDKGFLDFLADIELNSEKLTHNINEMSEEMLEMNAGLRHNTSEIERVNRAGGSGTASFVRKETKKAAKHIETFSSKLRLHNSDMLEQWNEIEKNTVGLLENPFSSKPDNKEGIVVYLRSLLDLKKAAFNSANSIGELRTTMQTVVGIERSMNQAVRFANEDLTTFVDFTEKLCSSIEKIIVKARFVVGNIEFESEDFEDNN